MFGWSVIIICPNIDLGTQATKRFVFEHFPNLEIVSVVIDIVRLPPVIDSIALEATVTEAVGSSQDPELVDESPATFVGCRTL